MIARYRSNVLLIALGAIATALRLLHIQARPTSYDENITFLTSLSSFPQALSISTVDVHPPLWSILEWFFISMWPHPEAWLIRVPSLISSVLTLFIFVALCRRLRIPESLTVVAFGLFSLLPTQIWYAQDGRMYAWSQLLVVSATYAIVARRYLLSTLPIIALLYTLYLGAFYVASLFALVLCWRPRDATRMGIALLLTSIAYSLWIPNLALQLQSVWGSYWTPPLTPSALVTTLVELFWGSSTSPSERGSVSIYDGFCFSALPRQTFALVGAGTLILLGFGTYALARERSEYRAPVLGMAFLPIACAVVASLWGQNVTLTRSLLATAPFLSILVARAVVPTQTGTPGLRLLQAIGALVSLGGVFSSYPILFSSIDTRPAFTEVQRIIALRAQSDDTVYHTDDTSLVALVGRDSLKHYRMSLCPREIESRRLKIGDLPEPMRQALGAPSRELSELPGKRVWVVALSLNAHAPCHAERIGRMRESATEVIPLWRNDTGTLELLLLER